jgi:hypothetical protein
MMPAQLGLVGISLWLCVGLLLGVGAMLALAGTSEWVNNALLRRILRSNKDGWALVQRGERYELEALTRDADTAAYRIGSEDDAEWLTDPADKMHQLFGVPFGLQLEGQRPIVDAQTAAAAERASEQVTDGGTMAVDQKYTAEELSEQLAVGSMPMGDGRIVQYINPFVDLPTSEVVDLRKITQLLRYDGGSDVPRKTAKNATEAERAVESGYGDLKEFGKIITAFLLGSVATFIGSSGGGGGGGLSFGVWIMPPIPGVF